MSDGYAQAAEIVALVLAELPEECAVSRAVEIRCIDYVGGEFSNGEKWMREMCCLPCRIRSVLSTPPGQRTDA